MRRRPQLAVVARAALLAAAVLAFFALLWRKGIVWANEFGGIAAFVLAFYVAVAQAARRWLRLPGASSLSPGGAADLLAGVLRPQWVDEDRRRHVPDPYPLPVRCRVGTPGWRGGSLTRPDVGESTDSHMPSAAEFGDIADAFQVLPSRRMVIVGPAGAGKTVMATQLAIHLTGSQARSPGGPLPVILPAVSWSADERLDEWISRELVLRWRRLAEKSQDGASGSLADALARDWVIPVIDGLDEMPEHLHVRAIEQINAWGSDKPLVLTSRPDEYDKAVAAGREVSRAARVEILPLSIEASKAYLLDATVGSPDRWEHLFRELKPGTPLGAALTVPLLLWLVRCIYGSARGDPGELADPGKFGDLAAIERHLIDQLIPAVYDRETGLSRFGCTPAQAERWLSFLAARPGDADSHDLQWWRFPLSARIWRPLAYAARGALLFGVAWLLSAWALRKLGGWRHGAEVRRILSGELLGRHLVPAADYIRQLVLRPDARSFRTAIDTLLAHIPWDSPATLELWVVLACIATAGAGLLTNGRSYVRQPRGFGIPARVPLAVAWIVAWPAVLAAGTFLLFFESPRLLPVHQQARARSVLLHSHTAALLTAAVFVWALADFASWLTKPLDVAGSLNASQVLRADRRILPVQVLLKAPIRAVVIWLFVGPVIALAYGAYSIAGVVARFALGSSRTASSEFADARLRLAAARQMPWRVMAFLTDAHKIGVLRQTGAAYQFCHGLLGQQLAARYWTRRVARLAIRRAPWLVDYLGYWSFSRMWSFSASSRQWSEPLWEWRFDKAARETEQRIGPAASVPHRQRPGMVQHFGGVDGGHGWVMCAVWCERPTLVAKPAWDALRQAAAEPDDDPTATLGFPVPAPESPAYLPWERVVQAGEDRIALRGGSWGPGRLTRDLAARTWRWEPEPRVSFVPRDKEWLPGGPPAPRLRLRAEATIPLARPDLPAVPDALQDLARQLASSDLARIGARLLAGPGQVAPIQLWQPGTGSASSSRQRSLAGTVPATGATPTRVIEVTWSVSHGPDSTTLTAAAELRVERSNSRDDVQAGITVPGDAEQRIPLEELLEFFIAAWHAAAELIPAAVLGDVTGLPLAGPPHVDLLASAATPGDLLFRKSSRANLSPSQVRALAAALLRERAGGLRRGRLTYFIDLTPFRTASRPPPLTELSARITAPLRISSQDQHQLARRAIAYIITLVSLRPRQKLTTSDPQWKDAVSAAFSQSSLLDE